MLRNLLDSIWIEARKATRSRMPLYTLFGILLIPLVDAFFMIILRDPEYARQAGLISAKAQLLAGTADWPTFLNVMAQAVAIGGIFLFSLIGSWVFGREFADGTVKDMLAVPVARWTILLAKFIVVAIWSLGLATVMGAVGFCAGALLNLPQGSTGVLWQGTGILVITTLLVVAVMTPVAFFASVGRGYLLPMGATILLVLFANVLAVAGWGDYFPWSVPALYAGAGDAPEAGLEAVSYWIVAITALAGMFGTYVWWQWADQSR